MADAIPLYIYVRPNSRDMTNMSLRSRELIDKTDDSPPFYWEHQLDPVILDPTEGRG